MRPISRAALGAATAAALAVTAAVPSGAAEGAAPDRGRPLTGSPAAAAAQKGTTATVTLVTGDRVLVTTGTDGTTTATALPAEDGSTPLLQTRQSGRDVYVYPEGAVDALAAGRVDEELFNVTGLIRQGYDDAHSETLPLIATYDRSVDVARSAPAAPRGSVRGQVLAPVGGVALAADKKKAAAFWTDVTRHTSRAAGDLKKLWLDAKVKALLDKSTKQVHADQAWAAGYDGKGTKVAVLDTGVDTEHPDLKGRVAESKNFTDSDSADDRQGHGTHTTSTVGGTGAASDGRKKGVAPGTTLLNGKVLNDQGEGATSWIIAGMQWAVDQKADVVSMSLGNPSELDCSDPMSQATQELARSAKDTLFVIAAGNSGPAANTVSSPGCVPDVLTVGAVDRDDSTASFSSRSPVQRTHTLKPEIAAPGVDISAAAAGGRGLYAYQSMSGTSMATPHVAGAAAIVKQRHPDWDAQQIKAALVSSADDDIPGDVRETGGGRLDVKAAIDETVLGADAVQGGSFDWPQSSADRTTVDVPYTNTTDRPVKLRLDVDRVTGNDGSTVRSTVARLGARTVTVPAGGTVRVPLALDPDARLKAAQYGDVTGRVVATGPRGVHISTPFSLYVQPETVTLTVKVLDRLGKPAAGSTSIDVIGTDDASGERRFNEGAAEQTYRIRPGAYFLSSFVETPTADGTGADSATFLGRPQVDIAKDTTVVLDARRAHRLGIRTDRPAEVRGATLGFARSWDDTWLHAATVQGGRGLDGYYADVQGRAHDGDFEFDSFWRAAAPQLSELAVQGGPTLHPAVGSTNSANLDGTGSAALVDGGSGSPEDLAAAKGELALVKLPEGGSVSTLSRDADAAGVKGLVLYREAAGRWYPSAGFVGGPLPVLAVETAEGKDLAARVAAGRTVLRWKATAKSPYVYTLAFPETGQIRSDRVYRVRDRDLAANTATYRAMGKAGDYLDIPSMARPNGLTASIGELATVPAPFTRTELYSPGTTGFGHMVSSSFPWGEYMIDPVRTYKKREKRTEQWYGGVVGPTTPLDDSGEQALAAERQGDLIGVAPGFWGDGEHLGVQGSFGDMGRLTLESGGKVVGESSWPSGVFTVPSQDAAYELTMETSKAGSIDAWQRSHRTSTTWSFRSHLDEDVYSQGIPLLFPHLTLPEDGLKTLPAKDGQRIGLSVTGHAGYTPGTLTKVALSYSYDDGETWTEAPTARHGGAWTASVDHAGATGEQVTVKVAVTDAHGNAVTQTVHRAYDVR
ncbi:S8 family serine peptidase [Streptomyces sp. SID5785]|uniref:S8 family serine peptidase n=1 Tax=Streptomyces sp. SID5785 TaxID=2690309 RepID=UPI001361B3EE|nr:S8 family serine peptidase [Streptomyces sp. SID5785]MZD10053.1 S8 family serine peptidase [Streptomyces sp. SID5785]